MPILSISEDSQKSAIELYNSSKKPYEKIPLMQRNIYTGWPLLQVSFFNVTQADGASIKYEHALGGGKCHYFHVGAFNLAHLLTKIPGPIEIKANRNKKAERNDLQLVNVEMFLDNFNVHHKRIGMSISSKSGAYGKVLSIKIPEGDSIKLTEALEHPFTFSLKPKSGYRTIGGWHDIPSQTETDIRNKIRDDVATFLNGQIFLDFSTLLAEKVQDKEVTDYFKAIFKVDEFLQLQAMNPDLQPKPQVLAPQESSPALDERNEKPHVDFTDLYSKIGIMKEYGESLLAVDKTKGQAAIDLADQLKEKAIAYSKAPKPSGTGLQLFKEQFKAELHSKDDLMKEHRELWKPIIANILLALTGIGLFAIVVNAIAVGIESILNNKPYTFNNALFFAKTNRELKNEAVEESVESIELIDTNQNQLDF